MLARDILTTAFSEIVANKLRSLFTLLGIIVSVAFLVAVVAIIQGMNAYVAENVAGAVIGANAFQIRRTPISVARLEEDEWRRVQRRPILTHRDFAAVDEALSDAEAVALSSGAPTPVTDVEWRGRSVSGITIVGATPGYEVVQDYQIVQGRGLTALDISQRRPVAILGAEVAEKLLAEVNPVGQTLRVGGDLVEVIGVIAPKGQVLGQSFDGFVLLPLTRFEMLYGRRQSLTISVKVRDPQGMQGAMTTAEEAIRVVRRLRPSQESNFSVETADALVAFWKNLTKVLFSVVPAVVAIGIVVGGIVIMNIMVMAVTERTREVGIRKAVGARARDIERQFLAEAVALSAMGGLLGVAVGWAIAFGVATFSPLPARISLWSVLLAVGLGALIGVIFGVYPARRAAALDPIAAMRYE